MNIKAKGLRRVDFQTRRNRILTPVRQAQARRFLKRGWSLDQIAGRFRVQRKSGIGYQTIYRYIYEDKAAGGEV